MEITKKEFTVLVMLYAANIDGNIQPEEVHVMLERSDFETVMKLEKLFGKMSDAKVIDCIRENRNRYAATQADKDALLADFRAIIEADEKCTLIEEHLYNAVSKILNEA